MKRRSTTMPAQFFQWHRRDGRFSVRYGSNERLDGVVIFQMN